MDTQTFSGRFSDGRTAATQTVQVRLAEKLEIGGPTPVGSLTWPYRQLDAATPLHWRDNEVLLRTKLQPGATLFISDPGFAPAILKLAPQLSSGAHRRRYAIPGLTIIAAILLGLGITQVFNLNLSQDVARLVPAHMRASIGQQALSGFVGGHERCTSPSGLGALDTLIAELSKASKSGKDFKIEVVKWDETNAFALPGEQIVVLSQLIDDAQSPDELAGVIAHEMGHGIELHPEAGIIRSLGLSALVELFASGQGGSLSNVGALMLQLHYSREAEHQADLHAIEILKNADISPKPFSGFFNRLLKPRDAKGNSTLDNAKGIFSTHPGAAERAKLAADAATYPGKPALDDKSWQALKHICSGA